MTKDEHRTVRLGMFLIAVVLIGLIGSVTGYQVYQQVQIMDCVGHHMPALDCRYLVTGTH
jgi:hypothetical protein